MNKLLLFTCMAILSVLCIVNVNGDSSSNLKEIDDNDTRDLLGRRANQASTRVVDGKDVASVETYPWMISLQRYFEKDFYHFCGGSLIHPYFILTAGHCIKRNTKPERVVFGTLDQENPKQENIRTVQRIEPSFYPGIGTENDVALLKLDKPIYGVPLMILDDGSYSDYLKENRDVTVVGWGYDDYEEREIMQYLQAADVPLISNTKCEKNNWYEGNIHDYNICAGFANKNGADACNGDSGGPLLHYNQKSKQAVQVGIVSWGRDCGVKKQYGVYTKVRYPLIYNWIVDTIKNDRVSRGDEILKPLSYSDFQSGKIVENPYKEGNPSPTKSPTESPVEKEEEEEEEEEEEDEDDDNNEDDRKLTTRRCASIKDRSKCCEYVVDDPRSRFHGEKCVVSENKKFQGTNRVSCQPYSWVESRGFDTLTCEKVASGDLNVSDDVGGEKVGDKTETENPSGSSPDSSSSESSSSSSASGTSGTSSPLSSSIIIIVSASSCCVLIAALAVVIVKRRRASSSSSSRNNKQTQPSSQSSFQLSTGMV